MWGQASNGFLHEGRKWAKEQGQVKLTSPCTRQNWQPTAKQGRTHIQVQGIKLATFGWWELKPPTQENYKQWQTAYIIKAFKCAQYQDFPSINFLATKHITD